MIRQISNYPKYYLDYINGTCFRNKVLTRVNNDGYNSIKFPDNKIESVHNLLFKEILGYIPEGLVVDHINRTITDNRPSNLRLVTIKQNAWNRSYDDKSNIHKRNKNKYTVEFCSVPLELFPQMKSITGHGTKCTSLSLTYNEAIFLRDSIRQYLNNELSKILTLQDIINYLFLLNFEPVTSNTY